MMKTKYFLMMIMAVSLFSIAARQTELADEIIGTWKYSISNVPPEYESGYMTFEQKDNKTVGYMGEDKQPMQELSIDQGKVSFQTSFDGGLIKYTLTQKGDSLKGAVSTPYGEFPVVAVKEAKK
ncbi:hypothetical protein L0657_05785 [Dyadobacter sp. CY345]|uniref:hypothetical protein n=1 Tax=Dyadobacter sp. CY345 TaxID=2909335 RepID=UPI001F24881D|nr:hypothetical protein [Dyadobacter sp. CY345]MCF2443461.1 hypothetical protein [Dyadobacter sp. CY345]